MATSFVVHRHVVSIKDSSRLKHNSYLAAALSSSPSQSSAPISTALRASPARLPSSTPQLSTQSPPSSPRPVDGILPTPCMPLPPPHLPFCQLPHASPLPPPMGAPLVLLLIFTPLPHHRRISSHIHWRTSSRPYFSRIVPRPPFPLLSLPGLFTSRSWFSS